MCTIPRAVATQIVILALKSWLSEHLPDWLELYVDLKNVLKDISMLNISRWYHNAKLRSERKDSAGKKSVGVSEQRCGKIEFGGPEKLWGVDFPGFSSAGANIDCCLTKIIILVPMTCCSSIPLLFKVLKSDFWHQQTNQNHVVGVFLNVIQGGSSSGTLDRSLCDVRSSGWR